MAQQDTPRESARGTGLPTSGTTGRYISKRQAAKARERLGEIDRRLGVVDARVDHARPIRF